MTAMNGTGQCVREAGIVASLAWDYDTVYNLYNIFAVKLLRSALLGLDFFEENSV